MAERLFTIWHMHLGDKGDPKAMSTFYIPCDEDREMDICQIERLQKIEPQFRALQAERVRWRSDNERLTADNDRLRADNARLRLHLEAIKTLKPLEPVGDYGDPYAEMTVSAIAIAVNALAGRALKDTTP